MKKGPPRFPYGKYSKRKKYCKRFIDLVTLKSSEPQCHSYPWERNKKRPKARSQENCWDHAVPELGKQRFSQIEGTAKRDT